MSGKLNMRKHRFPAVEGKTYEEAVREDISSKYDYDGDLLDIYAKNKGPVAHKWHHYIPIYARHFEQYRNTPVRFLEIGVNKGGSIQMWRNYLGPEAILYGIDINPRCAEYDGQSGQIRIGSQVDFDFLDSVVDEMGGVDIILDDGSHMMQHVRPTFEHLYPKLNSGGLYMIEDLHTAYLTGFGGGYRSPMNFFYFVNDLIHDMHDSYHEQGQGHPELSNHISGIHIYDSIALFEKQPVYPPKHSKMT